MILKLDSSAIYLHYLFRTAHACFNVCCDPATNYHRHNTVASGGGAAKAEVAQLMSSRLPERSFVRP
jgi:hypothetical protein